MKSWLTAIAVLGASCTRRNPEYCNDASECPGVPCDVRTHTCYFGDCESEAECLAPTPRCDVPTSSCVACLDSGESADCAPATPVCGDDHACRACATDDECDSGVCRDDGSCELADNVIYVAPGGATTGTCTQALPCASLGLARDQVAGDRRSIRLASGALTATADVTFTSSHGPVLITGPADATVTRTSGTSLVAVASGGEVEIRGFTANAGVECTDSVVRVVAMTIKRTVSATACTVSLARSVIREAQNNAVTTTGGTDLTITDARIEANGGWGVTIDGAQGGSLTVTRTAIQDNLYGGVKTTADARFDITNTIVAANGRNGFSLETGGAYLESRVAGNRFELNTVTYNAGDITNATAGGLFCSTSLELRARNNIVYANRLGASTTITGAQSVVNLNCIVEASLVDGGDGTNELGFASPTAAPYDFHLVDPTSPAIGAAQLTTITEDLDGQARPGPGGGIDLGADQYYP